MPHSLDQFAFLVPLRALLIAAAAGCCSLPWAQAADAVSQAAPPLPALQAVASRTSVSGLSSGAFMTVQYGVAFSSSLMGLGVVAGGPYNCTYVNFGGIETCMKGAPVALNSLFSAQWFSNLGQIDAVSGVAKLRVYVFGGTQDAVVLPSVVQSTRDFFSLAGVTAENLKFVHTMPAGHAFIAPAYGNTCADNATPYISHCSLPPSSSYDQPGDILQHIYGALQPPAQTLSASVQAFDQTEFVASAAVSMDSAGEVYIPQTCASGGSDCAVHVVFHGCKQGRQSVGDAVYDRVGYNRWADSNRLIVLYPQAVTSALNPEGCWDWWGYTGLNFMVRSGLQMSAIKAMVDRLTGLRPGAPVGAGKGSASSAS